MQLIITTNSFTAYEHRSLHAYFVACAITRKSYGNPEAEAWLDQYPGAARRCEPKSCHQGNYHHQTGINYFVNLQIELYYIRNVYAYPRYRNLASHIPQLTQREGSYNISQIIDSETLSSASECKAQSRCFCTP
jgi:hypothetical protein